MSDAIEKDEKPVSKKQEEKAVFDFRRVYWTHQREYSIALRKGNSPNASIEDYENFINILEDILCRSIVICPKRLLRDDAPQNIDWSNKDSLQWLLYGALDTLHEHFIEAYQESQKK